DFAPCWSSPDEASFIAAVDMDGDERLDLVSAFGEKATIWYAGGKCDFHAGMAFRRPGGAMRIVDLTGDDRPDLVATTGAAIEVVASNGGSHSARREFRNGGRNSDVE